MPAIIKWSNLLSTEGIDYIPEPHGVLKVSDDISHSIAFMTAATRHDRKMIQCNEHGAMLVGNPWDNLTSVARAIIGISEGIAYEYDYVDDNVGTLFASSDLLLNICYKRTPASDIERMLLPANSMVFVPYTLVWSEFSLMLIDLGKSTACGLVVFNK